jgi:hypothetical protein
MLRTYLACPFRRGDLRHSRSRPSFSAACEVRAKSLQWVKPLQCVKQWQHSTGCGNTLTVRTSALTSRVYTSALPVLFCFGLGFRINFID